MKKTILTLGLIIACISMSAQNLVISEIMISPPGDDSPYEFIEIRGDAGTTIADGTYIVFVEGDSGGSENPGDIESPGSGGVIDLSGQVIGSNGFLVILTSGNPYQARNVVDSNATVLLDVTDGTLEDATYTMFLVNSPTVPRSNKDIDADNDGTPDGDLYNSWTIFDSISIVDNDDFVDDGEFAYSNVIFCRCEGDTSTDRVKRPATATVIDMDNRLFDYYGRIGNSSGNTVSDWFAGDLSSNTDLTTNNWKLSTGTGGAIPELFKGQEVDNIGSANPTNATASIEGLFSSQFKIYPNPTQDVIHIFSSTGIEKIEIFNTLGKRVLKSKNLKDDQLNVSSLSKGLYLLKATKGNSVATRKIIKK